MSTVFEYRYTRHKVGDFPAQNPTLAEQADIFRKKMGNSETESLWVMAFDPQMSIIGIQMVASGQVDMVSARPVEMLRFAVRVNASSITLAHYHVPDDITPSDEDIALTKVIVKDALALGIDVEDHLIITDTQFGSIRSYMHEHMGNSPAEQELKKLAREFLSSLRDSATQKALEHPINSKPD